MTKAAGELTPLDLAILQRLPKEGEALGYHLIVRTVKQLVKELNEKVPVEARVTGAQVSGRLIFLRQQGLAVAKPSYPRSEGTGYQLTPQGVRRVEKEGK